MKGKAEDKRKKRVSSKRKIRLCIQAALDKKARDLLILDIRKSSSFADYFIICSGRSDRQVQGIAGSVEECLKEKKIYPLGIEGFREGKWILMDYGDVIAHIFYEPIREFYGLEEIWDKASQIDLSKFIEMKKEL
jgi:ribosome-associated protein